MGSKEWNPNWVEGQGFFKTVHALKETGKIEILLWRKLKTGNVEALGDLYDLFIDDLYRYGMHLVKDKDRVLDGIHDLFLKLYKYRTNLSETDNVKNYLLRSLKNELIKKQKNKFAYSEQVLLKERIAPSVEDQIVHREFDIEQNVRLDGALNLLSKRQKRVLYLRFNEQRSYEEIADLLEISVTSSRTVIYRALKILRGALKILIVTTLQYFQ
ncbi:RNA polymerase sigma factor [Flagellimonas iocasae]|uniref:RNA polymerase sigma factor n=1 Tax=Flagellimonas iocasae TaxID=2055905 RepID=A0ABW4Y1U9_9FLAO